MGERSFIVDPLAGAGILDLIRGRAHEDYAAAWIAGYRSPATRDNYQASVVSL